MSPDPQHALDKSAQLAGYMITARIRRAQGDIDGAAATLAEGERFGVQSEWLSYLYNDLCALQVRFAIGRGDLALAQRWAAKQELPLDAAPDKLRSCYYGYFTLARVLLAQQLPQAPELLERMADAFLTPNQLGSVIEARLLLALAHDRQGNREAARHTLQQAIWLAAPQGYVRSFVDEGKPMRALLIDLRNGIAMRERELASYTEKLLAAFRPADRAFTMLAETAQQSQGTALIEPLSNREHEILQLISHGLSNQEIAQHMVVAISTIKWHINNIYAKLDAHSRTQAVARAKDFGLL
jgi:LuxR family maltose regulon positive regulatory protein